ncbi:hypothetical protein [Cognatiyoonia sp. IB215182]|uniref:hypothetical protein n=1 Tax=Cognatiyoonia sp. IB215182 TaxID=3097353 RepID=UPI002A1757AF|nr:hypothetical protein [Cognatiyoonia sp. IB215182]MDX8355143.1 hypothetical protein [Cognatiyoonia sp. IB215182]
MATGMTPLLEKERNMTMSDPSAGAGSRMGFPTVSTLEMDQRNSDIFQEQKGKLGDRIFEANERAPSPPPKKSLSSDLKSLKASNFNEFRRSSDQAERATLQELRDTQPEVNTASRRYKDYIPNFELCVSHMQSKDARLTRQDAEDVVFQIIEKHVAAGYKPLEAGVMLNRMIEKDKLEMAKLPTTPTEKPLSLDDGLSGSAHDDFGVRNSQPRLSVDSNAAFAKNVEALEMMMGSRHVDNKQDTEEVKDGDKGFVAAWEEETGWTAYDSLMASASVRKGRAKDAVEARKADMKTAPFPDDDADGWNELDDAYASLEVRLEHYFNTAEGKSMTKNEQMALAKKLHDRETNNG